MGELERRRWKEWLASLHKFSTLEVDRCIKPHDFGNSKSTKLHHSADASGIAHGAVSYTRLFNEFDSIHCSFLIAKSQLGHLKPITVPRKELSAATLAAKVDRLVQDELDIKLNNSKFWSDSTSVLQYIKNEKRCFHTFIAN